MITKFHPLYEIRKDGKWQIWHMEQNHGLIRSVSAIYDIENKIPVETSIVTSTWKQMVETNVGRVNHRTVDQQAVFEINAAYKRRQEQGAVVNIGDKPMIMNKISPMLAIKFNENGTYTRCFSQPKIDGCLDSETIIKTDAGNFTIKDIVENNKGEFVESFDVKRKKYVYKKIINRMKNLDDVNIKNSNIKWLKIKTKTGKELLLTINHRIWLPEIFAWRESLNLKIGDKVLITP